ncbi:hypothetical protein ACLMJK_003739 [Lecanora helva]
MRPLAAVATLLLQLSSIYQLASAAPRTITATVTVIPLPRTVTATGTGTAIPQHHGNYSLSYTLPYAKTVTSVRTTYPVGNTTSSLIATLPVPRLPIPSLNDTVATASEILSDYGESDAGGQSSYAFTQAR